MNKLFTFLLIGIVLVMSSFVPEDKGELKEYRYVPVDDGMGGTEIYVQQEQVPCPPGIGGSCWENTGKCLSNSGLLYNCTTGNQS